MAGFLGFIMDVAKAAKPAANKPWAALKVSRREYEAARPWKKAGISRKRFEEIVSMLPDGFVEHIRLEADAERLLEAAFRAGPEAG
jgi:hypothetical protein